MVEEFAPNVRVANRAATTAATVSARTANTAVRGAKGATNAQNVAQSKLAGEIAADEQSIARVQSVQQRAFAPLTMEFFGMLALPFAWAARKVGLQRGDATLRTGSAVGGAMRAATIGDITHLAGDTLERMGTVARSAGGKAVHWAPRLDAGATRMHGLAESVGTHTASFAAPVTNKIAAGLDHVDGHAAVGPVKKILTKFANWRMGASSRAVEGALGEVSNIFAEHTNIAAQLAEGPTGRQLKNLTAAHETAKQTANIFSSVEGLVSRATHATGAERASLLKEAEQAAAAALKGNHGFDVMKKGQGLVDMLRGASRAAGAAASHEVALGSGGLRMLASNAARSLGRIPLLGALIGVGTVAGVTATWMMTAKQSKEGKLMLQHLQGELGAGHPVLQKASVLHKKQDTGRIASAGLTSVAEGATTAMMMGVGGGAGMGLMAGQMGMMALPQLGGMFVPENPILNAVAGLQAFEAKKIEAEPSQRVFWVRQLLGAMPQVGKEGARNKLVGAMAQDMVAQGKGLSDVLVLLRDEKAFSAYAATISEKQAQAAKAAASAPAVAHASAPTEQAAKPAPSIGSSKITAAAGTSQGRVHAHEQSLATA